MTSSNKYVRKCSLTVLQLFEDFKQSVIPPAGRFILNGVIKFLKQLTIKIIKLMLKPHFQQLLQPLTTRRSHLGLFK